MENINPISKKVIVVDSPSIDKVVEICSEFDNVEVVVHHYLRNQAVLFNWVLDNVKVNTEWILRLDADEYLGDELIHEMRETFPLFQMT